MSTTGEQTIYKPRQKYTGIRALAAEGARIGVVTCMDCGAALVVDPADEGFNVFRVHDDWHQSLDVMHGWAEGLGSHPRQQVTVRRQS